MLSHLSCLCKTWLYETLDNALLSEETSTNHLLNVVRFTYKGSSGSFDSSGIRRVPATLILTSKSNLRSTSFIFQHQVLGHADFLTQLGPTQVNAICAESGVQLQHGELGQSDVSLNEALGSSTAFADEEAVDGQAVTHQSGLVGQEASFLIG